MFNVLIEVILMDGYLHGGIVDFDEQWWRVSKVKIKKEYKL